MEILNVTRSLIEYLREKILLGELAPGTNINEVQLASELGISRGPLREALRVLEKEHLIVNVPRKASFVTEISLESLIEIYQAREMMECYAIDLLKRKKIKELPKVASALKRSLDLRIPLPSDPVKKKLVYLTELAEYHVKLVESAGNRWLIPFYQTIVSNITRYQLVYIDIPDIAKHRQGDHEQILELINKGSYEKAKNCLKNHINSFATIMKKKVD